VAAERFRQERSDLQRTAIQTLFADLDSASTFLHTARSTQIAEKKQPCLVHALKTYREVASRALNVGMPHATRLSLHARLVELAEHLAEFGESV